MPSPVDRVLRLREAGNVQRCHVLPHLGEYSNGLHTYQMLVLLEVLHPSPGRDLYRAILLHEAHERYMGDIPATFKAVADPALVGAVGDLKERLNRDLGTAVSLAPEEQSWIRALDGVEFWLWCQDQVALGSSPAAYKLEYVDRWIADNADWFPEPVREFVKNFKWRRTPDVI